MTKILDTFDGITAKGTEILAILTTNHPEKIHKGMVRPGRLDAVITIAELDDRGIEQMVKALCPAEMLGELEFVAIETAMAGFLPAFVKEAVDRTMRYAISRAQGRTEGLKLDTEDFVLAAMGLRPQLELMAGASDSASRDRLEERIVTLLDDKVEEVLDRTVQRDYLNDEGTREQIARTQ